MCHQQAQNFIEAELAISPASCSIPMSPGVGQPSSHLCVGIKGAPPILITPTCSKDNTPSANVPHISSLRSTRKACFIETNKIAQNQIHLRYVSQFMRTSLILFNEGSQMAIGRRENMLMNLGIKRYIFPVYLSRNASRASLIILLLYPGMLLPIKVS